MPSTVGVFTSATTTLWLGLLTIPAFCGVAVVTKRCATPYGGTTESTFTEAPLIPTAPHAANASVGNTSSSAVEMNPKSAVELVANGAATQGARPPPGSRSPPEA